MRLDERDPEALLSLPEFVKEPVPERLLHPPKHSRGKSYSLSRREEDSSEDISAPKPVKASKKNRSRSLSAPPLAWLLSPSSRTSPVSNSGEKKSKSARSSRPGSRPGSSHGRIEPVQGKATLVIHNGNSKTKKHDISHRTPRCQLRGGTPRELAAYSCILDHPRSQIRQPCTGSSRFERW